MEAVSKDSNDNMIISKTSKIISNNHDNLKIPVQKKPKTYEKMIIEAISTLKERNGTSVQAIKKYVSSVFLIPEENSKRYISNFLKKGRENGTIIKSERAQKYKLAPNIIKQMQKESKPEKIKKSKNKNDKENIAPVAKKSSTKITEKTKIKKSKLIDNANSEIDKEQSKKKSKKSKEENDSINTKEAKIKRTKTSKEIKMKKTKLVEDNDEPVQKKTKKDTNNVTKDINIKVTEKKNKIESKVKVKIPKINNATIAAGNKLKKKARKSLIKLRIKKHKENESKQ